LYFDTKVKHQDEQCKLTPTRFSFMVYLDGQVVSAEFGHKLLSFFFFLSIFGETIKISFPEWVFHPNSKSQQL